MEEKIKDAMRFYLLATKLKYRIRSGWDKNHWVVFNSPIVNGMIVNGAKTAFDIWYEWDKVKYESNPVFKRVLSYVKENNTNL